MWRGDLHAEIKPEDDGPARAAAQALHGEAVAQIRAVERRAGAEAVQQALAGVVEIGIEAERFAEMRLGLAMLAALEGGPAGIGVGESVVGIAREHAGEVRGVFGLLVLQAQRLGELVGGGGVVGIERERLPRGLLGARPLLHLQVRLRLGGEGAGVVRIEAQRGARGGERLLRPVEDAEDEGAQDVVVGFVRLDGDGLVDRLRAHPLAAGNAATGSRRAGAARRRRSAPARALP